MTKTIASKLYFFSLAAVVFTLPFYRGATNIALICLGISWFIAYWVDNPKATLKLIAENKVFIPVIGIYLLVVVGMTYSDHIQLGLQKLETLSPVIGFPFLLSGTYYLPLSARNRILDAFVLGVIVASFVCLGMSSYWTVISGSPYYLNPENGVVENVFFYHRLASHLGLLAVYFALFLCFAVLILVERIFQPGRSSRHRILFAIPMIYLIGVLYLLQSANITLALALALLILAVHKIFHLDDRQRKLRIYLGIAVALVVAFALFVTIDKLGSRADLFEYDVSVHPPGNWNAINLRLALWEHALILIEDHWLFGVGTGSIGPYLVEIYKENNFYFAFADKYHPHNQFLYSIAAWGIPGIMMLVFMFYSCFRTALMHKDALIFGLAWLYFQFSFTESTLVISKGIFFFFFFLSFLVYSRPNGSSIG